MKIPYFLQEDDYIQIPIMKRFMKDNNIHALDTKAESIKAIEEFADKADSNKLLVEEWITKIAKEGSKEICYHKLTHIPDELFDPALAKAMLAKCFSNCPMKNLLNYQNTDVPTLIYYEVKSEGGRTTQINFTFSNKFLKTKDKATGLGDVTIYPVFIEVYLNDSFIISRAKAKSTLYKFNPNNAFLINENKIDTMTHACELMDSIIASLNLSLETDSRKELDSVTKMLFKVYDYFSFTPKDVAEQIDTQNDTIISFIGTLFKNLNLDIRNKEKAITDARILAEKYISINGDNESIFTQDRDAYLIKITSDDELALTKIDTSSTRTIPLQCTEAFFDSKKSVLSSKKCKRLHLVFKRTEVKYFPTSNQLVVQFGTYKNHGYIKTMQYAEEEDLQNVLQTVFKNY